MEKQPDIYYEEAAGQLISVFLPAACIGKAPNLCRRKKFSKNHPTIRSSDRAPDKSWESVAAFNPTAFQHEGKIYLLYRAMGDDNISVVGWQHRLTVSPSMNVLTSRFMFPALLLKAPTEKLIILQRAAILPAAAGAVVKILRS